MNIFWLFCVMFMSCFEIASADTGLEGMLMNSLSTAKDAAKASASGKHVPGYSVQGAEALGSQISRMSDSGLKQRSHQRMQDASLLGSGTPGESIIMKGAARPLDQVTQCSCERKRS